MKNSTSGNKLVAFVLSSVGVALTLLSVVMVRPYVASRLDTRSLETLVPASSMPSPTPTPTATQPPTAMELSVTHSPTPSQTPRPTSTPTPASPSRIVIDAIEVDAPVEPVFRTTVEIEGQTQAMWDVPGDGMAGWHHSSAPLNGHGNTVINGHNTTGGEIFRDLYTVEAGELITVYAGLTPYTYTVTETLILPEAGQPLEVRRQNAHYILPTDEKRLTLVTCHPYGSLQYRLIVIAQPDR